MRVTAVAGLALVAIVLNGCGGDREAARGTSPVARGGVPAGASSVFTMTAEMRAGYDALPPRMRARFDALPADRRQAILERFQAMPAATRHQLVALGSQRGLPAEVGGATIDPVFSTQPAADSRGIIRGVAPFTVSFSMCRSSDSEGDDLKFRYDFEGTGNFVRGSCRESHVYEVEAGFDSTYPATICVSDRRVVDGEEACKSYRVQVVPGQLQCAVVSRGTFSDVSGGTTSAGTYYTDLFDVTQGWIVDADVRVNVHGVGTGGAAPTSVYGVNAFACPPSFVGGMSFYADLTNVYYSPGPANGVPAPSTFTGCDAVGYVGSINADYTINWATRVCRPVGG